MKKPSTPHSALTPDDIQAVSPALANYTQKAIGGDLWKRPGLSRRDRSIVTVSALIARIQTIGMLHYFNIASCLLHGVVNSFVGCSDSEGDLRRAWDRRRSTSGCFASAATAR